MTPRPTGRDEQPASAKICRAGTAHQSGRLTDAQTLVGIGGVLVEHHVTGDRSHRAGRRRERVLANPLRTRGLAVLITAGADVELARRMRAELVRALGFADSPPVTGGPGAAESAHRPTR